MVLFIGAVCLGVHLWSISWFPFVHSDEAWLASLSRTMVQGEPVASAAGGSEYRGGGPTATEEFFRLTPRHPHALKTLYHLLQGPLVVHWWHPVAARIPSLIAGVAAAVLVGVILARLTGNSLVGLSMGAAGAFDVQLFYISHLARQEALVVVSMLAAVAVLAKPMEKGVVKSLTAATIIGITIFIHPNAFVAAAAVLPWIVFTASAGRRARETAVYIGGLAAGALLALGASLAMDPSFFTNYGEFGASVGVSAGLPERIARMREFFVKIDGRHAGTYYLAPIRLQLRLLAAVSIIATATFLGNHATRFTGHAARGAIVSAGRRDNATITDTPTTDRLHTAGLTGVASLAATVIAIFVIGKYSPPSVVFLSPWLYVTGGLVLAGGLRYSPDGGAAGVRRNRVTVPRGLCFLATVVLVVAPLITGGQLLRELVLRHPPHDTPATERYGEYRDRIRAAIPPGEIVLANLNAAFAFAPGELRVWRDLGSLPPVPELPPDPDDDLLLGRPLAQFLSREEIRWVVLPVEELAMIYRDRPVWNEVYGNPHRFYPDLLMLLERYGTRVDRFEGGRYAMRLVPFMDEGPHHVEIYRLDPWY